MCSAEEISDPFSFTVDDFLRSPFDPTRRIRRERAQGKVQKETREKKAEVAGVERQSKATSEAGRKERERRLRALGRSGTIITGGRGLTERATVTRKTLLGE